MKPKDNRRLGTSRGLISSRTTQAVRQIPARLKRVARIRSRQRAIAKSQRKIRDAYNHSPYKRISRDQFAEIILPLINWKAIIPDAADALLNTICRMNRMSTAPFAREEQDLFFMPTQVRQIEKAIEAGYINENSVFVDVGCGPGARMPVYVNLRTAALSIGMEKYQPYSTHAINVVEELGLKNVEVHHCDALDFDYSVADVILLFRPVEGEKMKALCERIEEQTEGKQTIVLAHGGPEKNFEQSSVFTFRELLPVAGFSVFERV